MGGLASFVSFSISKPSFLTGTKLAQGVHVSNF